MIIAYKTDGVLVYCVKLVMTIFSGCYATIPVCILVVCEFGQKYRMRAVLRLPI